MGKYPKPTKAEQERIDCMKFLGCPACASLGIPNVNRLELHHLILGNKRMGHWFSIFLCAQHHRGSFWEELWGVIPNEYQVSIADGRKAFNAKYPTERQMWEGVQKRLKLSTDWPVSKVLPRNLMEPV
jgi:hypothetical protein